MPNQRPIIPEVTEQELRAALGFDEFEQPPTKDDAAKGPKVPPEAGQAAFRPGLLGDTSSEDKTPVTLPGAASTAISADDAKKFARSIDASIVESYLMSLGLDEAVAMLYSIFGRSAVRGVLKKGGQPNIRYFTKSEVTWLLVEARRTAEQCTVKDACKGISENNIDVGGDVRLSDADKLNSSFDNADRAIGKLEPGLRVALVRNVQGLIISWRNSREAYDVFERQLLTKQGWAIREKFRRDLNST